MDGQTFEAIESQGLEEWLEGISKGRCLMMMHRYDEAKTTLKEAVNLYEKTLGSQHSRTRSAETLLAKVE